MPTEELSDLDDFERELDELGGRAANQDAVISGLTEQVRDRDATVGQLNQQLANVGVTITRLRQRIGS